jgi:Carboxypeptidase regulatory-like domain
MMRLGKLEAIPMLLITPCLFSSGQLPPSSGTGVEGVITVAPIHPGPVREGVPSSGPLTNAAFTVQNETSTVTSFTTDAEGRFRVSLPPGHYTVSRKDSQLGIGHFGPFEVDVAVGKMTSVEWRCDSGMR